MQLSARHDFPWHSRVAALSGLVLAVIVVGHRTGSVRPTQNFVAQGFGNSSARLCSHTFPLLTPLTSACLAITMANQQDAAKTDPLTGMAHSEAHYFNRYAVYARP